MGRKAQHNNVNLKRGGSIGGAKLEAKLNNGWSTKGLADLVYVIQAKTTLNLTRSYLPRSSFLTNRIELKACLSFGG